ncbi:GH92 family glycosyl hydrolase [Terriglobus aquaticus]|uniref:GH92 family glycosyl hydrolase n=1 Tax=Terriglobus aquaticus TaxID=940139 RepID=A0ABW9KJ15_9BACT
MQSTPAQVSGPPSAAHSVDPFTAADAGGNVFVGPAVPFGMAKPGPDMNAGANDANAGWASTGTIRGFSQTHVSGTGGGAKYGNVLVQPTTGAVDPRSYDSPRAAERAAIGLYSVTLQRFGIQTEITAARRTSVYRFTYPAAQQANILFDMGRCLSAYASAGEGQTVLASEVNIVSPTEVTGSTTVTGGWNKQTTTYTVHFDARTDTPARAFGTWTDSRTPQPGSRAVHARGGSGGYLSFATTRGQEVRMKVGISFVSVEQARKNAEEEVRAFDFTGTRNALIAAWDKALGAVDVHGETADQRSMLYTALYHTMLMPVDRTGENPLWTSNEPYYDDYYAIWDTFRSSGPLLTLIAPDRERDMVRSLVDIYRHEGWLPDARSGNFTGRTQGGSNAEFLITDAYLKGLGGIDWATAYAAEVKDAESTPPDQIQEGRGGLDDWKTLGYVSIEGVDRPGSKQMEYAADDFEISLLADGLGKRDDAAKYRARSANWRKLWDNTLSDRGFQGFIRPRHRDGQWLEPFKTTDSGSWESKTFYEGNSWTYSLFVPQDVAGLIEQCGGPERFVARLDSFFANPGLYDVGNEPGFLSPYLYVYAGRQDKTAEHIRDILAKNYHPGKMGMAFNDDSGAMSSWYAFGQIGIFPNAGQDIYLIGSPALPEVTLHLTGGKDLVIVAPGTSATNRYVTAAEWNGQRLDRAWLRHKEIAQGGRLVLTMGPSPVRWDTGGPPPSYPGVSANPLHR